MTLLILVVLLILIFGPAWPSRGYHEYGYWPGGLLGLILIVVLTLYLAGRL